MGQAELSSRQNLASVPQRMYANLTNPPLNAVGQARCWACQQVGRTVH